MPKAVLRFTCCWGDWVDFCEVVVSVKLVFINEEGLDVLLLRTVLGRLRTLNFLAESSSLSDKTGFIQDSVILR